MKNNYKLKSILSKFVFDKIAKKQITKVLTFVTILNFGFTKSYCQVTYTFTNAGSTGVSGPSQGQINAAYASTNLNGLVTALNGIQSWTVPISGLYRIDASGAKGGNSSGSIYTGGAGAQMVGDFNLTAGSVIRVLVGQIGSNGGSGAYYLGGGGGGGSYVTLNSSLILAAAGGGGAGIGENGANGFNGNPGLAGTSGNIANGTNAQANGTPGSSGNGGLASSYFGGGAGSGWLTNGGNMTYGMTSYGGLTFANNGTGGAGGVYTSIAGGAGGFGGGGGGGFGGAGGGGYSGGAPGTHGAAFNATAGGGGGSFNSGSNQVNTPGINNNNGVVKIINLFYVGISQSSSIACNGLSTAVLNATVGGGVAPYTYTWSPAGGNAATASGLIAGTYTCSITDANLSVTTNTFLITQPAILSSNISAQTNVTCNGGNNGVLTVNAVGGTSPYSFTWTPSGGNSASASSLAAGNYSCSIKDANNCAIYIQTATVTQPSTFAVSGSASSSIICNGFSTVLNGSGATTYTWSGGISNGVSFSPVSTISYSLTGSTALGCLSSNTAVVTVTVNQRPTISVNSGSICNGQFFLMVPSGASTYTFQGGSASVNPITNTTYSVIGTSSLGCLSSNTVISSVIVNTVPIVSVNNGTICSGQSFTLIPSGASTYTFSNGNAVVSPITNTSYSITGMSAQGCISSNTAVSSVVVYTTPTITVNSGVICSGQAFTMNPIGANTYTYSTGNSVNAPLTSTSYSVIGTSLQGCVSSNTAISNVTVNITPTISVNSGSVCSGLTFILIPSGAFSYTFSSGSANVTPTANAVYFVNGTSAQGCVSSNTAVSSVTVFSSPTISVNSGAICSGQNFTINPFGANTFTFSSGTSTVSPLTTTNYSVIGSSTAGCLSSNVAISSVTVNALPTITITGQSSLCIGNTISLTANGASTYVWTAPTATTSGISVSPTVTTSYSVIGTDLNGCIGTAVQTITVNQLPTINATLTNSIICLGETTSLTATGGLTYSWNTNQSTSIVAVSPSITTTYTVVGTDSNNCSNSSTITQSVAVCIGISPLNFVDLEVSIFPNPSNGEFYVSAPFEISISIFNELGQIIKNIPATRYNANQVSFTDLPNGIYFLIAQGNNQINKQKLIITK